MSDDTYVWRTGEALDHSLSNFGTTPNELVSVTGPSTAKATLMRTIADFRVYVATGLTSPPPERWISWVELYLVIHLDPGPAGSHPSPFSDDPRIVGTYMMDKLLRTSPSSPTEYTVQFSTTRGIDWGSRRVGSGSAFSPSHLTATIHLIDPGFDMDGVFAYSTAVNWNGTMRGLFLTST